MNRPILNEPNLATLIGPDTLGLIPIGQYPTATTAEIVCQVMTLDLLRAMF